MCRKSSACAVLLGLALAVPVLGDVVLLEEGKLADGWTWLREDPSTWRIRNGVLELRIQPGNMWGPANDARNVLLHDLPATNNVESSVTFSNTPAGQWEQGDLVWYYDDSHMVKIGQEMVDGQLSIVMGREEKDRTRTIAIIPIKAAVVEVRHTVQDNRLVGSFREAGHGEWKKAGECDLPAVVGKKPRVSLQFYQGLADVEHWVRVTNFRTRAIK